MNKQGRRQLLWAPEKHGALGLPQGAYSLIRGPRYMQNICFPLSLELKQKFSLFGPPWGCGPREKLSVVTPCLRLCERVSENYTKPSLAGGGR